MTRLWILTLALLPAEPALHAQDRVLTGDFPEVWRVGGLDAPEWAQFTHPGDMAFDGSGNLYVVDEDLHRIVKIGPDGNFLMTIGRPGEGPGEFGSLYGVIVWRDGTMAANDGGRELLHLFDADGDLERTVRWGAATGSVAFDLGASRTIRPGPRPGVIYAQGVDTGFERMLGAIAGLVGSEDREQSVDEYMIESIGLSGDVVDGEVLLEAWRPPRAEAPEAEEVDFTDFGAMLGTVNDGPYFEPDLRWDAMPNGAIAYVDSTTYDIRIVWNGETLNRLSRPIDPVPVTRRIESDVRARLLREVPESESVQVGAVAGVDVGEIEAQIERAIRDQIENREFYPVIPAVVELRATWDDALWVKRMEGSDPDADLPIDVFDPRGNYIGTLPAGGLGMPRAFGPNGLVAFWDLDELDIPSISVRHLPDDLRW